MAQLPRQDVNYLWAGNPVRFAVVLDGCGGAAMILAVLFFGGSFYVENEIGRAFSLAAFFSGLLGSIMLFGFANIIEMLDSIHLQALDAQGDEAPESGTGSNAATDGRSP